MYWDFENANTNWNFCFTHARKTNRRISCAPEQSTLQHSQSKNIWDKSLFMSTLPYFWNVAENWYFYTGHWLYVMNKNLDSLFNVDWSAYMLLFPGLIFIITKNLTIESISNLQKNSNFRRREIILYRFWLYMHHGLLCCVTDFMTYGSVKYNQLSILYYVYFVRDDTLISFTNQSLYFSWENAFKIFECKIIVLGFPNVTVDIFYIFYLH